VLPKVIASKEFKALANLRKWSLNFAGSKEFSNIVKSDYNAAKKVIADIGMK